MEEKPKELNVYEILSNRGQFMDADHQLGEVLQRTLDGTGTVEECLAAVAEHQASYNTYVSKILVSLGSVGPGYPARGSRREKSRRSSRPTEPGRVPHPD